MTRVARLWRTLGRPQAALLGVQYTVNDQGLARAPWRIGCGQRRPTGSSGASRLGPGGSNSPRAGSRSTGRRAELSPRHPDRGCRSRTSSARASRRTCRTSETKRRARACSPPARSPSPARYGSRRWRAWSRTCGSASPGSNPASKAPGGGNARCLTFAARRHLRPGRDGQSHARGHIDERAAVQVHNRPGWTGAGE